MDNTNIKICTLTEQGSYGLGANEITNLQERQAVEQKMREIQKDQQSNCR